MLPTELMQDFIGKVCAIVLFNSSIGISAKIEKIEGNWIRVVNKKGEIRLINAEMIRDIEIMPEKYQKF